MPRVRSQVTIREAKKYLKKVKDTVSEDEYQIFMNLIQESKDKKSDIGPTIIKVIELFKHNRGLLSGFNCFLPEGYKISSRVFLLISFVHTISSQSRNLVMPRVRSQVTIREAKKYLKKVKDTVSEDEYQIFINLIQESKDKKSDIGPTIIKVIELFKHNGGLLSGFNCFLPEGYKIVPLMTPGRYEIREAFRRLPTQNQDDYEW